MRRARLSLVSIGLALALAAGSARAQTAPTRDDIVGKLNHFEAASEVDLAALKQQVMERAKTRIKNDTVRRGHADYPAGVVPDGRPPRGRAGPRLAAALHISDRRPCRSEFEDARGQCDPEPASGRCDPRRAGEHVQDLGEADPDDRARRGTISRPGAPDVRGQRPDAGPDICQGARRAAGRAGPRAGGKKARQKALVARIWDPLEPIELSLVL